MADITNVTKYFPTSSETYVNNLSASISSEAETVPVNAANQYLDGDVVVLVVEPGTTNEAVFTGTKASSPDRFIDCVWTEGNKGVGHASGAPIVDFVTATHNNMTTKGILKFANQDGTLKADPIRNALGIVASTGAGWETFPYPITINAGDTLGSREYNLTVANQDITPIVSKGMKLRLPRTGTPPTQSADFNGTSGYASRPSASVTGHTFTDDFSFETWVYLDTSSTNSQIFTRYVSATSGYQFKLEGTKPSFLGRSSGSSVDTVISKSDIPLNKWVHIAFTVNMSATDVKIYIDGKLVDSTYGNGASTVITQGGDLSLGSFAASELLDGKLAEVRLWNTIRSLQEIRDNMNQQLTGTESGLVGYWKLNGDFNDSTTNANHFTAQGGAGFTTQNPFNSIEYGTIIDVPSFDGTNSTLKVYSGENSVIPNETLGNADYSAQQAPYKLPTDLQPQDKEYDSGWVSPAFENNYTSSDFMMRKIGNIVYIRGLVRINSGNIPTSATTFATIPSDWKPTINFQLYPAQAGSDFRVNGLKLQVAASGTRATIYVDGVMWLTD